MTSFHDPDVCHSILDSLPTVMCVVDMHKKIVFWSDGAERITGHLRHAVIGHSCVGETLLHCDQPGCEFCKEDCPIARAIKTSHPAEAAACWPATESSGGENGDPCQSPSAKPRPSPTTRSIP